MGQSLPTRENAQATYLKDIENFHKDPVSSKLALDRIRQFGDTSYGLTVTVYPFNNEREFLIDDEYVQYLLKGITIGEPAFGIKEQFNENSILLRAGTPEYNTIVQDVGFLNKDGTIRKDRPPIKELYAKLLKHPIVRKYYAARYKEEMDAVSKYLSVQS